MSIFLMTDSIFHTPGTVGDIAVIVIVVDHRTKNVLLYFILSQ